MESKYRWVTLFWICTSAILFGVLVSLGVIMRMNQAGIIQLPDIRFYAYMTLHGVGMAGTLYVAGLSGVWYLLSRYINVSRAQMWAVYVATIGGVGLILVATLSGDFAPGWYVLYPLPFVNTTWPYWSIGVFSLGLLVLGVAWLAAMLDILRAMAERYGSIGNCLGWQYFSKKPNPIEVPPLVLIAAVGSIAGVIAMTAGGILMMLYMLNWFSLEVSLDPLLLKNLVFLFGHTLMNMTMYYGVAIVYEILPEYTKRPWKTNKIVVAAWNTTLVLVIVAYWHHLYMDHAQPLFVTILGQVASYISPIPATVATIFGTIGNVYRSGMKRHFVPLAFLLGFLGWLVGGVPAVIDATVAANFTFHNTLWVPGHFHTYYLVGYVFIICGFTAYIVKQAGGEPAKEATQRGIWTMAAGGYGFVTMFYIGGVMGVPRRFANYTAIGIESVKYWGQLVAQLAVYALAVFIFGLLVTYIGIFTGRRTQSPEALAFPTAHPIQRLMDNPWLLLALGFLITLFSYTFWGWMDLAGTPKATLP